MSENKQIKHPAVTHLESNEWSTANALAYEMSGRDLMCAVCRRGGGETPPAGKEKIDKFLDIIWSSPHTPVKVMADLDVSRAHFFDVYEGRNKKSLPDNFAKRSEDFSKRRKDLETCRLLGIYPNTVLPAIFIYDLLFERQPTLSNYCYDCGDSTVWPECPHARKGFYEKISQVPKTSLTTQTIKGEELAGQGLWAMFSPRSKEEMNTEKKSSADFIINKAKTLYIRPLHTMCIICTRNGKGPFVQDNLVELRERMLKDPDITVTLTEGCCMVCDSCNIYHQEENICYFGHPKNILRDLRFLEKLGLKPGATLPARELYQLIYDKIPKLYDLCAWNDGQNTTKFWAECGAARDDNTIADAKKEGFIVGSKE